MSSTPITDAARLHVSVDQCGYILLWPDKTGGYVEASVASYLECELNDTRKKLEKMGEQIKLANSHTVVANKAMRQMQVELAALRAALERIIDGIPACNEGELVVLHYDGEGNELGFERVDPLSVIQRIEDEARAALAAVKNQTNESNR